MKTLRYFTTILTTLLVSNLAIAQSAEKVLVKSFNLKGKEVVVMELDGNVEVKRWNNDIMRVQMSIKLTNGSNSILKSLIQARRYHLTAQVNGDELQINMPSMDKQVRVSGMEIQEKISYTVYAPAHVQVKLADDTSASIEPDNKKASAL